MEGPSERASLSIVIGLLVGVAGWALATREDVCAQTSPRERSADEAPSPEVSVPEVSVPDVSAPGVSVLGGPPLCEASAIAALDASRFVVADNEIHDALFLFDDAHLAEAPGRLAPRGSLPLPHGMPHDLEAIARSTDSLVLVGSFSRRRSCEPMPSRRRIAWLSLEGERVTRARTVEAGAIPTDERDCLARWLGGRASREGTRLCEAIVRAEHAAHTGRGARCDGTLDIEGASLLDGHLWLGLRAPLVDGRAALVRVSDRERFVIDEVRLVDLGQRGVRALETAETTHGPRLFAIAGPTGDREAPHVLYRLDASGPVRVAELPARAEGLAIQGDRALVVIDGARSRGAERCDEPAEQLSVALGDERETGP